MILTGIAVLITLTHREIGKNIVHPKAVKYKENLDNSYIRLCERVTQGRLERNAALEGVVKLVSVTSLITLLFLAIIGFSKTNLFFEITGMLLISANLAFGFTEQKQLKQELKQIIIASFILLAGFVLMETSGVNTPEVRNFKRFVGQLAGDPDFLNRSTYILYFFNVAIVITASIMLFRIVMGLINEFIYILSSYVLRFSNFLGETNALAVLFFLISSGSYLITVVVD